MPGLNAKRSKMPIRKSGKMRHWRRSTYGWYIPERFLEGVSLARRFLGNTEGESVSDLTGRALRELESVEGYDEGLTDITQQLQK